jgi:hypothetical protein
MIGGPPARFAPFSQLFQQALERLGQAARPVGVHSPGHVAATDERACEVFWPHYLEVIRRVSKTRGFAVPTKESFLREIGTHGALYVGRPRRSPGRPPRHFDQLRPQPFHESSRVHMVTDTD